MEARSIATPVIEWLAAGDGHARGAMRGATHGATYLDLGGVVVAVTRRGVPLMPNGIAVDHAPVVAGGAVRAAPGRLDVGSARVTWDAARPPAWEPAPRRPSPTARPALERRGTAILRALGIDGPPSIDGGIAVTVRGRGQDGARHLRRAIVDRDPDEAARSAERLIGLGDGLTPEGDDVLAATAATVAALGDAVGFAPATRDRWLAALVPSDVRERTTPLSATLLQLAIQGRIAQPVHPLLDTAHTRWRDALARLEGVGASTGRAYAVSVGSAMRLLTA
ncbi:MAG: hypothetical protein QOD81_2491 [Solirubrobacteraceae bacterium]|jgi:hypothetical protein|nr:hypothetical protein [Solirubrobacteraceae bacterium]